MVQSPKKQHNYTRSRRFFWKWSNFLYISLKNFQDIPFFLGLFPRSALYNYKLYTNWYKMTCKGICTRYKAQKPVGTGRYASGQRRCQICEIFIKWEGLWCPCCGYRLRTKPRKLKYKAKLRARVEADAAEQKESISIKA